MQARNYSAIFLICLVVGAEANLIRDKANSFFKSRGLLTANVNDYVDETIGMLGPFMKENGLDPMILPDIEEGFEVKPVLITYSAWLKLTEGRMMGLVNVARSGDQRVSYIAKTLRVRVQLQFSDLEFAYNYLVKVMNIGPTGIIIGSLSRFVIIADVLIDFNNDEIHLQQFSITEVGRLRVRFGGNILFDWLLNPVIGVFTRLFNTVILKVVELNIRSVAQDAITSINAGIKDEGQEAVPKETTIPKENLALTGFFNDGVKRIDIVLVLIDDGTDVIKEMRLNFLMNIIQFGLEVEVELGKMLEHQNLIFVKLHAPDAIIEEFGLYFNEKNLFKESHLEFMNPIVNFFGVSNERELIKIIRTQYPGPENYSTLERSNIVYKILLKMPFGKHKNHFGIHRLIDNFIIQDAFALHDGPYFIVPKQSSTNMNARQVLFYEWLGMINVWKTQPIHMIHEYFGKRISYYFAFYEYFNFMLFIAAITGAVFMYKIYNVNLEQDKLHKNVRYGDTCNLSAVEKNSVYVCPECRNYTLCPLIRLREYCPELKFLTMIDTDVTTRFGTFIVIWGIFFLVPWRYRERYLSWIWEESKGYLKKLVRTEYKKPVIKKEEGEKEGKETITNGPNPNTKVLIRILTVLFLDLWVFLMFRFSIIIWHYPRWKRLHQDPKMYVFKHKEHEYIAESAGIYTVIVVTLKMILMILAQKLTERENYERFVIYERSLATKMYAFSFITSFMIFITYTFVGAQFKDYISLDTYEFMNGYAMMNNGAGSSFDDICITLAIMTILEHVIFRIAGFCIREKTDYSDDLDNKVPCWEREYKLKPITDFLFYKLYNAIVMEFALITCYSMTFPMAALFIFIINIWDVRYTARQFLLECRRPLLINTAGPGFWKYLIMITAFYASISNICIILFQSHKYSDEHIRYWFGKYEPMWKHIKILENLDKLNASKEDYKRMEERIRIENEYPDKCQGLYTTEQPISIMIVERTVKTIVFITLIFLVLGYFLYYVFPRTSNSLEDAIKKERRIKNKYYIRKGFAK